MNARIVTAFAASALLAATSHAQVVADSACEKYAVDIAAFATCDSPTRVARPEATDGRTTAAADGKAIDPKAADKRPAGEAARKPEPKADVVRPVALGR